MDPRPLTLRQLFWMAEGRGMDAWARTGTVWEALANAYRDIRKHPQPFTALDVNPYAHLFPRRDVERRISVGDPRMEAFFREGKG